ncbi:MAG TPA: hypothetical protein DCW60_02895 [Sutterella sp.]|nr:hypothetical protein [Sutterella sp.]
MNTWTQLLILLGLIALNGLFAMSEIAIVASRRSRLAARSQEGDKRAQAVLKVSEEPTRALSAIQVGITTIGICSGIVGEYALAEPLSELLAEAGLAAEIAGGAALVVVVIAVTYFSIVLGELVPKRLGQINPEGIACRVIGPLRALSWVVHPFVRFLAFSTDAVLGLFGERSVKEPAVTEEEIHAMLDEGSESGAIEETERDMVKNVFGLDDRTVGTLMTPESEIVWIDLDDPPQTNLEKLIHSNHARLPVASGSLDEVRGFCSTRTLLRQLVEKGEVDFAEGLAPAVYVPETIDGMQLLNTFRKTDVPTALVIDEYGAVQGLVTPQDVLEAIAGEFKPDVDEDPWVVRREDGSLLLDGMIPVPEFTDLLELKDLPEDSEGHFNTLAGMIIWLTGHMPHTGDIVTLGGWRFEVVDMDGRKIDKVLVKKIAGIGKKVAERDSQG